MYVHMVKNDGVYFGKSLFYLNVKFIKYTTCKFTKINQNFIDEIGNTIITGNFQGVTFW